MAVVTHLLESRRSRIGRWAVAALLVCALHVGGTRLREVGRTVKFPPAPDQLPGETFEYKLPLKFKVE
jgi:hypothetical protein